MRPRVIFNSAMSLDGRIREGGEEADFLSRLDRYRVHELRGSVDAVMVDVDMIILENPELGSRTPEGKREPYRVIVDAKAEIREDSRILSSPGKKMLVVSKEAPHRKLEKLQQMENLEVVTSGEFAVNLDELLDRLYDKGIRTLLLEGEGGLVKRMLNEGYIDEMYVTVVPTIIGKGNELFEKPLEEEIKLDLEGIFQYGDQVVLHYLVKK